LVQRTGKPPTGYQVTFRYWAPAATSVRIEGEWYFSSPARTTMASSEGLLPTQWRPGDFPIAHPNSTARNWPVTTMAEDHRTGVWSYTTPLPSGVFTYGFYINCPDPSGQSCTEVSDPGDPPWNTHHGVTVGSVEASSQVYIPSDPAFGTIDYWWQGPARARGKLVDLSYPSSPAKEAAGANRLAVYTPPGYDPHRAALYPTLYLSHGGPGNEVDWTTRGDAANILDNLIGTAEVKPMLVVMTNFNGSAYGCGEPAWALDYDQDLIDNVVPYVQAHYHVSRQASQRAFAGLSCGGYLANSLLLGRPADFGYYGVMSPLAFSATLSPPQVVALRRVGVLVGGGRQDPIFPYVTSELADLQNSGARPVSDFINGGHEWYVWRILLRDFLTRVAFSPVPGHS
jgi:enterochelin esterase-like enzyme